MAETTLLLMTAIAWGTCLSLLGVGGLVARRNPPRGTLASIAFPAFWCSSAVVAGLQGARSFAASLGMDAWPLVHALEELTTPFYCLAAAALCYYVFYLVTGRSVLAYPVAIYFLAMAVLLRYHLALAEPIGHVVTEWQVHDVYAAPPASLGYAVTLALVSAPVIAAATAYAALAWRLEDAQLRWRIGWVGTGLLLWAGAEALAFATGIAAAPEGEILRRAAALTTALLVVVGYARPTGRPLRHPASIG